MSNVSGRKLGCIQKAIVLFYSRIVLNKISLSERKLFRNVERISKTYIKINADLTFLQLCLKNQLLPKFTDFKLYDEAARYKNATTDFKLQLIEREIKSKKEELNKLSRDSIKNVLELHKAISKFKFYSLIAFLQRSLNQYRHDIHIIHDKKLSSLYGGNIYFPDKQSKVLNISNYIKIKRRRS